ncbi:sulfatase [Congregibacter variabilis]|uniref:Sulfatase n=1 Tax=Congregibacter variabilis TaxID=3081200 RepID=A0ABZ0I635_9GAMM|nr:sulfatase [Congregibacter sp. IMCC43200]
MIKKAVITFFGVVLVAVVVAWINRIDLMLALVKYRSSGEYVVGANRVIAWDQGPAVPMNSATERPPNIILILADDLGINDISTFGGGVAGGRVQTPNIDQLAAQGAIFTQAYAGNATCAPSRAMIMTGRYPTRTGFEFTPTPAGMGPMVSMISRSLSNGLPPGRFDAVSSEAALPYELQGLPGDEITVAEVLREKGYHTAHIGKWHLGRAEGSRPNDQGFDESLLMASGLYLPEDDPNVVNARLDFDPIDQFLWARLNYAASYNNAGDDRFEPGGYLTDYWTDESIKVIKANRNRPFFLYLAHWGAHTPLQATREDYDAVGDIQPHRLRVYAAMIRALDRSVGRIMATLEEQGLAENTMLVFSSDNGGAGYVGLPEINAPYRGWKLTNFEGGLRVPMLVKWPARISGGTLVDKPVAHIDVMPTIAAAAQADTPPGVPIDGLSLLPLATRDGSESWSRETLFWQSGYYRAVRHGDWKLQVSESPAKNWLYNLADDPSEWRNLAGSHPEKLAELEALLDKHQASARAPLYPFVAELPVAVDKTLAETFKEGDEYIYWPN